MILKVTFAVANLHNSHTLENSMYYLRYLLHMNGKANVACNFNCLFGNERLLKVTGSHVPCKGGSISETVQDGDVVTTDH